MAIHGDPIQASGKPTYSDISTEDMSSVATEEMSSVATEEMSSVATEEMSSVATEEMSDDEKPCSQQGWHDTLKVSKALQRQALVHFALCAYNEDARA